MNSYSTQWNPLPLIAAGLFSGLLISGAVYFFVLKKSGVKDYDRSGLTTSMVAENNTMIDRLKQLQQLDTRYSLLLADSETSASIDSVNIMILETEIQLNNSIRNLETIAAQHSDDGNMMIYQQLMNLYKQVIDTRRSMSNIRYAFSAGTMKLTDDQQSVLLARNELNIRDVRIIELERTIGILKSESENSAKSQPLSALATDTEISATNEDLKLRNSELAKQTAGMKRNIEQLNLQIASLKQSAGNTNANLAKTKTLQLEIDKLHSDLAFAEVDCNLIRADSKRIISNSRQRKELLTEVLNRLNKLSQSENIAVQQKANEKMKMLNGIVQTIRD